MKTLKPVDEHELAKKVFMELVESDDRNYVIRICRVRAGEYFCEEELKKVRDWFTNYKALPESERVEFCQMYIPMIEPLVALGEKWIRSVEALKKYMDNNRLKPGKVEMRKREIFLEQSIASLSWWKTELREWMDFCPSTNRKD